MDDEAFVAPVHLDYLGGDATASDALFAELGTLSEQLPRDADRNQIIAILIGLKTTPSGAPTSLSGEAKGSGADILVYRKD